MAGYNFGPEIGGVTFRTDVGTTVEKSSFKYDKQGNKIYCVWFKDTERNNSTSYIEYPQQSGASILGSHLYGFNNAYMQGSKSPDDISLSNCNNCTVDISQDNNYKYTTRADFHKNSTCTHDIVNIFDGSNNTVKAGNGDRISYWQGRQVVNEYHGGLFAKTQGTYNQEKGKIK